MATSLGLGLGRSFLGIATNASVPVGDVWVPVGARGRGIMGTAGTSTGAFDSFNGQNIYWGLSDTAISSMKVAWADWEMQATGPTAKASGAVFNNFSAGLNYQQVSQGDFLFAGAATGTLGAPQTTSAFSYLMSDAKSVTVAANNSFGIRMFGNMTVGTNYGLADYQGSAVLNATRLISAPATPGGSAITGYTEGLTRANTLTDGTAGTANPSHTGLGWLPPTLVLGLVNNPTKSVVVFGDSIAQGQNGDYIDNLGNLGYTNKTWRHTIPWLNLSRGTLQAAFFNTSATRAGIDALTISSGMYVTDFICALGRNDMAGSSSAATIKSDVDFVCASQKAAGRRCWVTTIPPWTTSSDNWITTTNQTLASSPKETIRNTYNADRLANYVSQGYRGVIDICPVLESSGKWACPFAAITLNTAITTAGQTGNISVSSTAALTAAGLTSVQILIGSERIQCTVLDGTQLTIVSRGAGATTAATYTTSTPINIPLTNDGIHPNSNGHELLRVAGVVATSKFGT